MKKRIEALKYTLISLKRIDQYPFWYRKTFFLNRLKEIAEILDPRTK